MNNNREILGRDKIVKDKKMLAHVLNDMNKGIINRFHPLQRKTDQWGIEAKSGLAASIIKQEDIDSIKVCEVLFREKGTYTLYLIDGLQRLTVLDEFKNDGFAMRKALEMPVISYQGINENGEVGVIEYSLAGKKYSDLPEELKERFDSYPVEIVKHLDCTSEEVAYHIRRYNRQTSMNPSQKGILEMPDIVKNVKSISDNNEFFKECGNYGSKDGIKGVFDRIVNETIMFTYFRDNWIKGSKMYAFLNDNATNEQYDELNNNLNRLSKIINMNTNGQLFNAKNSFIWLTSFHEFLKFKLPDIKFAEFLDEFGKTLHNVTFEEYNNESFDSYDTNRSTKDKKVVFHKLDMIIKLMKKYFGIEENVVSAEDTTKATETEVIEKVVDNTDNVSEKETSEDEETSEDIVKKIDNDSVLTDLDFIRMTENKEATEEDLETYNEFLDNCDVRISSPVYQLCKQALLAITAYAFLHDKDIEMEEWINEFQNEKTEFGGTNFQNYTYIKNDFKEFLKTKVA